MLNCRLEIDSKNFITPVFFIALYIKPFQMLCENLSIKVHRILKRVRCK